MKSIYVYNITIGIFVIKKDICKRFSLMDFSSIRVISVLSVISGVVHTNKYSGTSLIPKIFLDPTGVIPIKIRDLTRTLTAIRPKYSGPNSDTPTYLIQ
jgi:hypothetical protein